MKKAKIMLTAIIALAIVGGALAFKAKKFNKIYCTTITNVVDQLCPVDLACPVPNVNFLKDPTGLPKTYCYTLVNDPDLCPQAKCDAQLPISIAREE